MREIAEFFVSFIWLFGALLFWPALKFLLKVPAEKLKFIKWLFWLQVFWLAVSFSMVQYYRLAGYKDWLHSLMLPYIVGAISWAAVIVALFVIGLSSKSKS